MVSRQSVCMEQTTPLSFQISVIQVIKKLCKITDHNVAVAAVPNKLDGFPGKINIALLIQISPIGDSHILDPQPVALFVVTLIEQKIIQLKNTAVNVGGIVDLSALSFYPTHLCRVFAHIFGVMDKRVKSMPADIFRIGNIIPAFCNVRVIVKMSIITPAFFNGFL